MQTSEMILRGSFLSPFLYSPLRPASCPTIWNKSESICFPSNQVSLQRFQADPSHCY